MDIGLLDIKVLKSNTNLYHSNMNMDFSLKNKEFLWTSYDINQSKYHLYDSFCARYKSQRDNILWPCLYTLVNNRPIYLLIVKLNHDKIHIMYFDDNYITIVDFLRLLNINEMLIDDNELCNNSFIRDCNYKLLKLINFINEKYNTNIDGYICDNDQNEIALLKPYDFLIITERMRLKNIRHIKHIKHIRHIRHIKNIKFMFSRLNTKQYEHELKKICDNPSSYTYDGLTDYISCKTSEMSEMSKGSEMSEGLKGLKGLEMLDMSLDDMVYKISDEESDLVMETLKITKPVNINMDEIDDIYLYLIERYPDHIIQSTNYMLFNVICELYISKYIENDKGNYMYPYDNYILNYTIL